MIRWILLSSSSRGAFQPSAVLTLWDEVETRLLVCGLQALSRESPECVLSFCCLRRRERVTKKIPRTPHSKKPSRQYGHNCRDTLDPFSLCVSGAYQPFCVLALWDKVDTRLLACNIHALPRELPLCALSLCSLRCRERYPEQKPRSLNNEEVSRHSCQKC